MQSRNGWWRAPILVLTGFMLALAPVISLAQSNRNVLRTQRPQSTEEAGQGVSPIFTPPEEIPIKQPYLYPRAERFWNFEAGPHYGGVSTELVSSPDVIFTRVGSFLTNGPGLPVPAALREADQPSGPGYYIVQFTPAAFSPAEVDRSLRNLTGAGAKLIDYVANNGYLIHLEPAAYGAVAGSRLIQFIQPYHPGYKIAPDLGTAPLPDPDRAASPVYSLAVRGFPGSSAGELADRIVALGGVVTYAEDNEDGAFLIADLHKDKVVALARITAVRTIDENLPRLALGEESSWNVIAGTYIIGQKPSIYLAGVTGSGNYLRDVDNAPTSTANPRVAGPEDIDWNGNGIIDNAAQVVSVLDTGMAVDAGDFSETAVSSGWTGNGGNAGPNVPRFGDGLTNRNHRKIAWYEVAPGGFGAGDTRSCDPAGSHGTVTSGQAVGNASSGPFKVCEAGSNAGGACTSNANCPGSICIPVDARCTGGTNPGAACTTNAQCTGGGICGLDWDNDGTSDGYGDPIAGDVCGQGFCFTSGALTFRVDGVAPGGRLVFQDVNSTCPEPSSFSFGSYSTMLGSARGKGSRLHSFSFGAFNVATGSIYDTSARAIDDYLATDANRDFMMFIAAGNNGAATANTAPYGKSNSLSNEATAKNAVVVGANFSGNSSALQSRVSFSAIGPAPNGTACTPQSVGRPAPSNCGRIKPDVMAPGSDGNTGLAESYNCISSDGDQIGTVECLNLGGNSGTSFSTPNVAGAAALIRDYFAQGLYPDGTSANAGNEGDRVRRMSGSMVKTLLICSANHMEGGGLFRATGGVANYDHRVNPEYGFGFVNLRKALPLTGDPLTPQGLIVKDGGCPTGQTCADNLPSLTNPLGNGASTSAEFEVLNRDQELRVVVGWVEPSDGGGVGALRSNLDLEVRWCGTDNNCATNPGDVVWYGNVFTEDVNDDGTADQNLDGTSGMTPIGSYGHWRSEGGWSLANRGDPPTFAAEAIRDNTNNVEAVMLSPDPEGDGTAPDKNSDNQLRTGKWQITIRNRGPESARYTVCVAGAVAVDSGIRLDRNPIGCNGDVAVSVNEVVKASTVDPVCNTTNNCIGATVENGVMARTKIAVTTPGGTTVDAESASGSKTRFKLVRDAQALSFRSGRIPVSAVANLNADDDILVAADSYVVTATYTDQDCTADGTAGCQCTLGVSPPTCAEFKQKTSQSVFDCTPNVDFFQIGTVGRNTPFLLAGGCDDDKYFDKQEVFTYLVQFGNLEADLTLSDVEVTLRAVVPDGDNAADPGRLNNASSPYVAVRTGTVLIDKVFPGFLQSAGFTVVVLSAPVWPPAPAAPPEVELVVGISSSKAGKTKPTYGAFKHILNADDETFLYSTDYPTGASVDRDINANERIENPIRDPRNPFPTGGSRDNVDKLNETITFSDLTTTAFGGGNPGFNGPWDFDIDDEGFRSGLYAGSKGNTAEVTNWGEDQNYNKLLDGPFFCLLNPGISCSCTPPASQCAHANCTGGGNKCIAKEDFDGDQDGTLDQGWNLLGGCGYLSSSGTNRGVWHTGQIGPINVNATIANCASNTFPANPASSPPSCENMDTLPGVSGTNLWLEFLRTPVINKVRKSPDNRGINWRVELVDWRWNMNADYQPDMVGLTWEFDMDTASLAPVDLGDGLILRMHDDGLGPINGANVNLTRGFPVFVENDPDNDVAPFGQNAFFGCLTGPNVGQACSCTAPAVLCDAVAACTSGNRCGIISNGINGRNRQSDRSCVFQGLTAAQTSVVSKLLREPSPIDDDCDNDNVNLGPDGCPGYCGVDDDGDQTIDNPEEACPCYTRQDTINQDSDPRTDEGDERQRFYRCKLAPTQYCRVTGIGTDDCGANGPCGRFGNGAPRPYGDDVCGDNKIDESTSDKWATETVLGENGRRIAQNQNWHIGTVNGPFLRFQTLEDFYDRESGETFQGAVGFIVYEGTPSATPLNTYGVAIDDMTVEWSESHPVQEASDKGCGNRTCLTGPRAGRLCFNNDDCGAGHNCSGANLPGRSCAAMTWGTTNLYSGSGIVSLNIVDFNASTTQGTFSCIPYGFTVGCGGGNCAASNDCDNDGLLEIEAEVRSPAEPSPERFRLEQTEAGASAYTTLVSISSSLSAPNDGVVFVAYNGTQTPAVTALYFDKDPGGGDFNGDGTVDGPPNKGVDNCSGYCGVDEDLDGMGPDKRPGAANVNDDNNGICDFKASNVGANCTVNSNCIGGGVCLNVDEGDELCGRTCTAGTTSGLCSANSGGTPSSGAPGASCVVGSATCNAPGTCIPNNCTVNADCGTGGNCPGTCRNSSNPGAACTSNAGCPGGYCAGTQRGDDNCSLIDEADEMCAIVAGKLVRTNDNCGCDDNPITANLNAVFNVADIVIQDYTFTDSPADGSADNDGFADDNEKIRVRLTLRNLSSFDVDDVKARLTTQSSQSIACINDPDAKFGRINSLQSATNGPTGTNDLLVFTVGTVARAALADIKQATFQVTVTGTAVLDDGSRVGIEGTVVPQTFTVDLDLSPSGGAPPAATTTRTFGFENASGFGNYTSEAAWNADWGHTFVETQNALHCQYNYPPNPLARHAPVGCFLRQDPGTNVPDDWHIHSTVRTGGVPDGGRDSGTPGSCIGGASPGGACSSNVDCPGKCTGGKVPGELCIGDPSVDCLGACSGNPTIRCSSNALCAAFGLGTCTAPGPGTCNNPVPGTCSGQGKASMHLGFHGGGTVQDDTVTLNNIFYAWYKPTVQLGLGRPGTDDRPTLDFWHQSSITDDRIFSNVAPPFTAGAGVVHVLVDRNNDGTMQIGPPTTAANDGWWEKIIPWYGVPAQQRRPFGNCVYDPNDDGNNATDIFEVGSPSFQFTSAGSPLGPSSTCYPEFVWGCSGDTQDPPYDPNLGQVAPTLICFTEVDTAGNPIFREGFGPGRWVRSTFDLYRYRGRKIWFRFLVTDIQVGFANWNVGFGGSFGGNREDGWYIDDLKLTGLNASPFALIPDNNNYPPSPAGCPSENCTTITPRFTGSTFVTRNDGIDNDGDSTIDEPDEGAFSAVSSDAPMRLIELNGQDSANPTTSNCLNGILQYRFWVDVNGDGTTQTTEIIRDWADNPRATANSAATETIRMNVRCTAAAPNLCTGTAQAQLVVTVAGRVGPLGTVTFGGKRLDGTQTCRGTAGVRKMDCLEWKEVGATEATSKYDVASRLVGVTNPFGAGGSVFTGMTCRGSSIVCQDSDGDGKCEFNTTGTDNPTATQLSIWLVREDNGSWNELGNLLNRDTFMSQCP